MSVQRYTLPSGVVRYRARVKHHGREVATRVFVRKKDALAWESEQRRRLVIGEWIDPRRGRVPLSTVAEDWLRARQSVKRSTREADAAIWRLHVEPWFGRSPVSSISAADVSRWLGDMIARDVAQTSARRNLAALRSLLDYAVADARIASNVAARVKPPRGSATREGQYLTVDELRSLREACRGRYGDVVLILGLAGLRWGEAAGLRVGDFLTVPGPGLRVQRSVLSSRADGQQFVDTVKTSRARTVPLVSELLPVVERWSVGRSAEEWLFAAPKGGAMSEANWKRAVLWSHAIAAIGRPRLRVHDLRHTAASVWLGAGADPKVVQRVLGHASAAMTMDLYGHLIDANLWDAARRVDEASGGTSGASGLDRRRKGGRAAG
jgi:integrase